MGTIQYLSRLDGADLALAIKAWDHLNACNLSHDYHPTNKDIANSESFVFYHDDEPIAIMTFCEDWAVPALCGPVDKGFYVNIAYVISGHQGKEIYSKLWNALIILAKLRNVKYICSWISPNNQKMRDIAKKQGREEHTVYENGHELHLWLQDK